MKVYEELVTSTSEYFLNSPSQEGRELFFYPVCLGRYEYKPLYNLSRNSYDSYLLMQITKGKCTITAKGQNFQAQRGQLVFLDCYKPHGYSTETGWSANWIHFDGPMAGKYFEYITNNEKFIFTPSLDNKFTREFEKLFTGFKTGNIADEASMSLSITSMLTELIINTPQSAPTERNRELISDITYYINTHFKEDITLEQLADMAHLSPFYFTKLFKAKTGYTPHEYVITTRLNHAKYLLSNTNLTIKEICFACGFASESRFCTSFKKFVGVTPSVYKGAGT